MMDARFSPWSRCVQKSGTTVAWRAVCPRSSCATHMRHSNKTKSASVSCRTNLALDRSIGTKEGGCLSRLRNLFWGRGCCLHARCEADNCTGLVLSLPPTPFGSFVIITPTYLPIRSSKMGRLCTRHIMVAPQKPRCRLGGAQPSQCAQQCLV